MEQTIIDRTIDKLTHVEVFQVSMVCLLPTEVRAQLALFAAIVLEQHMSPMKVIDFGGMINDEELTEEDQRLVTAIHESNQTQLEELGLGTNMSWWQNA